MLAFISDGVVLLFNVTLIRGLSIDKWIFLCLEITNGIFFSSLLSIIFRGDSSSNFATCAFVDAVIGLVISPGSVKTLSLEDSWLGGVGISVTTRPLFAKRHESVTSNGGSWVCGVVGVCTGVDAVVGVVILERKDSVVVTHDFGVIAVSL